MDDLDIKIEVLNRLIEAANKNGADAGGSYNQAMPELKEAITSLLYEFTFANKCDIIETYNLGSYSPYKIVRR